MGGDIAVLELLMEIRPAAVAFRVAVLAVYRCVDGVDPVAYGAQDRNAFQLAFEELGGSAGLVEWAKGDPDNMGTFYSLYARMIPHDINAHVGRVRTEVILPVAPSE